MVKKGSPDMFFVADDSSTGKTTPGVEMEEIDVLPLDAFCEREEISHISFLKIDTEGGDLNVLKGAEKMLSQQRVDFVEVEAGMNCGNKFHVPFETLRGHLEERNYSLFAIYEQVHEWPANEPQLRRANLVFMSRALIASTKVRGQSIV